MRPACHPASICHENSGGGGEAGIIPGDFSVKHVEIMPVRIVRAAHFFQAFARAHRRLVAIGDRAVLAFQNLVEGRQRQRVIGRVLARRAQRDIGP